jgi:hypothetical protein
MLKRLADKIGWMRCGCRLPVASCPGRTGNGQLATAVLALALLIAPAVRAQQPVIDSITPASGPIGGGTVVSLRGQNLNGLAVTIDRKPAAPLSQSATEIRLQVPAHDNGYAIVAAGDATARFLYLPPALRDLPPGFVTTVAGIGQYVGEYGPATSAAVQPLGIGFDASGVMHFADPPHNRVFRVRNGVLETVAGTGLNDGPNATGGFAALDTPISFPRSVAFDSKGNLYVPDTSYYLWRITPARIAEIVAGNGRERYSGDGGAARQAEVGHVNYVAVDHEDNVYVMDWSAARVRKIDTSGIISTYIGTGTFGFSGDGGAATAAQFDIPFPDLGGLAVDRDDNLLLLDWGNRRIRRINHATGVIETILGPTVNGQSMDNMRAMAVSPANELYFANAAVIFRRNAGGSIVTLNNGARGFADDGATLASAKTGVITALAFDAGGNLYFTDDDIDRVRKVDAAGRITTVAGMGPRSFGEGGNALAAALIGAGVDLAFLPSGELAISDGDRLHELDRNGSLVRLAGSGLPPPPLEDVPALQAAMSPNSVSVAADGTIDLTEGGFIMRIDRDGIVRRIAGGTFQCDLSGDNADARQAGFCQTFDAVRDRNGNLFIADSNNNRVRRVDAKSGIVTTIAGSGPTNGLERYGLGTSCGDGGPATSACINTPYGLAFDDDGNLYVEENERRIRKIDRAGIISTLAEVRGTKLTWAFGNLFMVNGDAVSRVSPAGLVTRLNGTGIGFGGDGGPFAQAHVSAQGQSDGVAVDAEGNLFFSDGNNLRVRAVRYGAVLAPPGSTIQLAGKSPIRATVFDSTGRPAAGVRVDFAAPSSGASCIFSSSFAITDANGEATVSCAGNCVKGSYTVTATPLNSEARAQIAMTNAAPCGKHRATPH